MDNIDGIIIPSIAEVITYCLNYIKDEDFNIDSFVEKINLDVGISRKILLFAHNKNPTNLDLINDFKKAIKSMEINEISNLLAKEQDAHKLTKAENEFFNLREFNRHSYFVSRMAGKMGKISSDTPSP